MLKLQCQVTLKQELEKTWRSQPDHVEADPKCASKCFCCCSQRDRLSNLHRLNLGGTHQVLVKRHHCFWMAASLVAQSGEISRSWEGSVAAPGDGCNFNLCCTAPAYLQAPVSHFLRGRSWPCLSVCPGKGLSCRRAVQWQLWLKAGLAQSVLQWRLSGAHLCQGSMWSWFMQWKSSCFLGQVESYAGNKSCVHRAWDKEKTMECLCGDLAAPIPWNGWGCHWAIFFPSVGVKYIITKLW